MFTSKFTRNKKKKNKEKLSYMRYNHENLVNGSSIYMSISHPFRYKIYKTPTTYITQVFVGLAMIRRFTKLNT